MCILRAFVEGHLTSRLAGITPRPCNVYANEVCYAMKCLKEEAWHYSGVQCQRMPKAKGDVDIAESISRRSAGDQT